MSFWSRPRNLALIGGGLLALAFVPNPINTSNNPFQTQATQNVTNRFSSGGGSDVHTPGVATKRGDASVTTNDQINPKGMNTEHYKELQADQRPGKPGPFDKAFNKSNYGHEQGK
ncbi:hypothetical protein AAFC00_002664 [Neodothiora populina]|uniref:Uncharacterized protein n=1 Tax=Neodothiora populina TaxID=2781224 RepID=A0ABR3P969_9PEZI